MLGKDNSGRSRSKEIKVEFPRVLFERFETICEEKGFSKDEVIRTLVDDFVENYAPDEHSIDNPEQINAF